MEAPAAAAAGLAALEEDESDANQPLLQRAAVVAPPAPAPATLPAGPPPACAPANTAATAPPSSSSGGDEQLLIEASLATFPRTVVVGVPVAQMGGGGALVFLPDDLAAAASLPSVLALWQQQRSLLLAWLLASVLCLLLWAPLCASDASGSGSSPLALVAQLAAVMGCAASGLTLIRRYITDGHELHAQLRVVSVCGGIACCLDVVTSLALMATLWSLPCDADDQACLNAASFALLLGLATAGHAYASLAAASRARALLGRLDPVSSGAVTL